MLMLKEGPVGVCCSGQVQLLSLSPSIVGDTRRRIELAMHARSKNWSVAAMLAGSSGACHVNHQQARQQKEERSDF